MALFKVQLATSVFLHLIRFGLTINSPETTGLKSVQIIFRHGERPAEASYLTPTAGLTETGKKQMYELGLYFRERYSTLVKTKFDVDETSIISSDNDRAIRSGELAAFGLYKDFNLAAKWNGEKEPIPYEPIPVRAIPPELDRYLQPKVPCPKEDQLFEETGGPFLEGLLDRHSDLLDIYIQETKDENLKNSDATAVVRVEKLISFMEHVTFNSTHGLPLEEWTKSMLRVDDFRNFLIGLFEATFVLPEERKLYGGSLLGLIVDGFKEEVPKKLKLFAGHDRVMYALMRALDIYDPFALTPPPYGAALMFELHQDSQLQRELVKIFYRNDTRAEPQELKLPTCADPCTLPDFVEMTKDLIPIDYEKECQVSGKMVLKSGLYAGDDSSGPQVSSSSWVYVVGVVGAAAAVCLVVAIGIFVNARKSKDYVPI
jgi:lysosomal acid phosphatase